MHFQQFLVLRDYIQLVYLPAERLRQGNWPVNLKGLRASIQEDMKLASEEGLRSYYKIGLDYYNNHDISYLLDSTEDKTCTFTLKSGKYEQVRSSSIEDPWPKKKRK